MSAIHADRISFCRGDIHQRWRLVALLYFVSLYKRQPHQSWPKSKRQTIFCQALSITNSWRRLRVGDIGRRLDVSDNGNTWGPRRRFHGGGGGGGKVPPLKFHHCFDDQDDDDGDGSGRGLVFKMAGGLWLTSQLEEESESNFQCDDGHCRISEYPFDRERETAEHSRKLGVNLSCFRLFCTSRGGDIATKESRSSQRNTSADHRVQPFQKIGSAITKLSPFDKSKYAKNNQQKQKDLQEKRKKLLASTKVQSVTAPQSTLLPQDILTQHATCSNLIGGTLTSEALERTANGINQWYWENGYVLNSVTGATLVPNRQCDEDGENKERIGSVEIKVREIKMVDANKRPRNIWIPWGRDYSSPISIKFVEPFKNAENSDASDESNDVLSLPVSQSQNESHLHESHRHQLYKVITGRTRPSKIARMVKLAPGSHFRILPERWTRLVANPEVGAFGDIGGVSATGGKGAIFSNILAVRPIPVANSNELKLRSKEDAVLLEVIATENKPNLSVEYGVTKSLFSDQWEGEFDLKHGNAFGGGEVASLNIRKGRKHCQTAHGAHDINESDNEKTSRGNGSVWKPFSSNWNDGPLSWRMSLKDDNFCGGDAGYDLELFRDYVGIPESEPRSQVESNASKGSKVENLEDGHEFNATPEKFENDPDCPRRIGATIKFSLPPPVRRSSLIFPRTVAANVEHIESVRKGSSQSITNSSSEYMTSLSVNLGPYSYSGVNSSKQRSHPLIRKRLLAPIRSSLAASLVGGASWKSSASTADSTCESLNFCKSALPYASGTLYSQTVIPLHSLKKDTQKRGINDSIHFAMRHVLSASSRYLPRHEAIMLGLASRVRGYKYNYQSRPMSQPQQNQQQKGKTHSRLLKKFVSAKGGRTFRPPIAVSNSISGVAEIRFPTDFIVGKSATTGDKNVIPSIFSGTLVLFGDWAVSQAQIPTDETETNTSEDSEIVSFEKPFCHSSIGIGFRKVLQGLPLKVDACITDHGTKGVFFGMGKDFSA